MTSPSITINSRKNKNMVNFPIAKLRDEGLPIRVRVEFFYEAFCSDGRWCFLPPSEISQLCGITEKQFLLARKKLAADKRLVSKPHKVIERNGVKCPINKYRPAPVSVPEDDAFWELAEKSWPHYSFNDSKKVEAPAPVVAPEPTPTPKVEKKPVEKGSDQEKFGPAKNFIEQAHVSGYYDKIGVALDNIAVDHNPIDTGWFLLQLCRLAPEVTHRVLVCELLIQDTDSFGKIDYEHVRNPQAYVAKAMQEWVLRATTQR